MRTSAVSPSLTAIVVWDFAEKAAGSATVSSSDVAPGGSGGAVVI